MLYTWVGYSALVCLLKHLNSDQLLGGMLGQGMIPNSILLQDSSPDKFPTPENPVATHSEERKDLFILDINWGGRSHSAEH